MIEQIQEIGALIAAKIFGKSYMQLRYECGMERGVLDSLKKSELYECAEIASVVRMEAFAIARHCGRDPTQLSMEQLLDLCEQVLSRPEVIEKQKVELRRKGFLAQNNAANREDFLEET